MYSKPSTVYAADGNDQGPLSPGPLRNNGAAMIVEQQPPPTQAHMQQQQQQQQQQQWSQAAVPVNVTRHILHQTKPVVGSNYIDNNQSEQHHQQPDYRDGFNHRSAATAGGNLSGREPRHEYGGGGSRQQQLGPSSRAGFYDGKKSISASIPAESMRNRGEVSGGPGRWDALGKVLQTQQSRDKSSRMDGMTRNGADNQEDGRGGAYGNNASDNMTAGGQRGHERSNGYRGMNPRSQNFETRGEDQYPPKGVQYSRNSSDNFGRTQGYSRGGEGSYSRHDNYRSSYGGGLRNDQSNWSRMLPANIKAESQLFTERPTGINFDDYEKIPVSCSGYDKPEPITSFNDIMLNDIVANNVKLCHYDKPTPVQKYALPTVLMKRDLMACAQTGSGKTAAFLVPIISSILNEQRPMRRRDQKATPSALILTPTRELCIQIHDESRKFCYRSLLQTVVVYGGASAGLQIRELRRGADLLVATPGRLIDLLTRGILGLTDIRYLVLDEADRMLDMGFEPQIRRIIDDFNMPFRGDRVTLMFSATFPKAIQELAGAFLHEYIFLSVGRIGSTSENIVQKVMWVDDHQKPEKLLDLLYCFEKEDLILVFVETKRGADILENFLINKCFRVACIHGDRNQREREMALKMFRNGKTPILVATAVAARGLDVPNVRCVINFDMPTDIDEYVHRIGRTGRVGNLGEAISFFNNKNSNVVNELIGLLEDSHQDVPDFLQSLAFTTGRGGRNMYNNGRRGCGNNKRFSAFTQNSRDHRQVHNNRSGGGYRGGFHDNRTRMDHPMSINGPGGNNGPRGQFDNGNKFAPRAAPAAAQDWWSDDEEGTGKRGAAR